MPNYFEGEEFDYEKWFGSTTHSYRTRVYLPNDIPSISANWRMHVGTSEDGGPLEDGTFTSTPFAPVDIWYMRTSSNGRIDEVSDFIFSPLNCYVNYSNNKEIKWSSAGLQNVGSVTEGNTNWNGSCGTGNGYVWTKIEQYYPTFTIPAVTSNHGWSCPAATFNDVIRIRIKQYHCQDASCSSQSLDDQQYWYAKDFGAIKLWSENGYVVRRLCDENPPKGCICAADWIDQNN
ncbi:MAG: hypothetical protein Tsb0027_22340 [Wenzhouxiangellaceae bacterium]